MRKLVLTWMIGMLALAVPAAWAPAAMANQTIGMIDMSVILSESDAAKEANRRLQQEAEARQAHLDELRARVEQLQARLEHEEEELSPEEMADQQSELIVALQELEQTAALYEAEIQQMADELRAQILADVGVVLQRIGDARGYDLIIDASAVWYYKLVTDLTWEVIREYNSVWNAANNN
ncbi:MAG: OmpH family outer membrane protein [Firmicutes bacterium]|nr:OmpH family outer membrane protein [Bacillota bacterium]